MKIIIRLRNALKIQFGGIIWLDWRIVKMLTCIRREQQIQNLQNLFMSADKKIDKPRLSSIQVFIRVRRLLQNELGQEEILAVDTDSRSLVISDSGKQFQQKFDWAFSQISTQVEVFQQIYPTLSETLKGVNMTIFAYGQTGSGKTYTMFGNDWENQIEYQSEVPSITKNNMKINHQSTFYEDLETDINSAGIIPRYFNKEIIQLRTIYNLFKLAGSNYFIYCSFLQIYNERIYDLLQDYQKPKALNIHESKIDGIFVGFQIVNKQIFLEGLSEYAVNHYYDCLMLMKRGEKNRVIRQTSMNAKSSRSHTIFQVLLETSKADQKGRIRRAKINLCDLAGSEKINKGENIRQEHLLELKNINQSLTTLGKVIQCLTKKQKVPIPYRESKLTRLLQDSLGGHTQTILIANVSSGFNNVDESYSTLKFAERAKNIVLNVKSNKINATDNALISKLQREIDYLKSILQIKRNGLSGNDVHMKLMKLQVENERLKSQNLNVQEVEKLLYENRQMKLELQKMQSVMTAMSAENTSQDFNNEFLHDSTTRDKTAESKQNLNTSFEESKRQPYYERVQSTEQILAGTSQNYAVSDNSKRYSSLQRKRQDERTFFKNGLMVFNNPTPITEVQMRVRGKNNQYVMQQGYVEQSSQQVEKEKRLKQQRNRVLERLQYLEQLQHQSALKLQEQSIPDNREKQSASFTKPPKYKQQLLEDQLRSKRRHDDYDKKVKKLEEELMYG